MKEHNILRHMGKGVLLVQLLVLQEIPNLWR